MKVIGIIEKLKKGGKAKKPTKPAKPVPTGKSRAVFVLSVLCALLFVVAVTMAFLYAAQVKKGKKMSDIKVAVLDWAAVIAASPTAQKGDQEVANLRQQEEKRILSLAEELQKQLETKVGAERTTFEEEARKKLNEEIEKSTQKIQQVTAERVQQTIREAYKIIKKYCEREGIDLVLNTQTGIIYSGEVLDITDAIIEEIKKR